MNLKHNSVWQVTAKAGKRFPALSADISTEVAVVGGGISGLTCAYLLGKAGKKVVLLEAREIGFGTTGNSTGNLYGLVDEHLSRLKSSWGLEKSSQVVQSRLEAINFIESVVKENGIDCEFKRVPF